VGAGGGSFQKISEAVGGGHQVTRHQNAIPYGFIKTAATPFFI